MSVLKLAALDVDGTLMDSQKRLVPAVVRAVDTLCAAGVEPVIATGRALCELRAVLAAWPRIRYCILSNGACVLDVSANARLYAAELSLQTARAILSAAGDMELMVEVCADNTVYVQERCWGNAAWYHAGYLLETLSDSRTTVPDIGVFLRERKEDVDKLEISFHDLSDLARLRAACAGMDVSLAVSIHDGLEVNCPSAAKGTALAALCGLLGVDAAAVAALGDSETDVSMLRFAGLPIAMGNATNDVKAVARVVVPDNDHAGAAMAIESYMLGGKLS